jgi:hypothetical protein
MAITNNGSPTIEYVRRNNKWRKVWAQIKIPFLGNGYFLIQKKSLLSAFFGAVFRPFGFYAPVPLNSRVEAYGLAPREARRVAADAELMRGIETLTLECGLTLRTDEWGLVAEGRSSRVKQRGETAALSAITKVASHLDALGVAAAKNETDFRVMVRWISVPAAIAACLAVLMGIRIDSRPLLEIEPLLPATAALAVALTFLLAMVPGWFFRRSPFALPAIRTALLGVAFASGVAGLALAQKINAWAPRQELAIQFEGHLIRSTTSKGSHYILRPDTPLYVGAFDVRVTRIEIGRSLYEQLGGASDSGGQFEVVIDRGALGAAYAAEVRRAPQPGSEPGEAEVGSGADSGAPTQP